MEQARRILVVDDDQDTLDLIRLTLTTAGYAVDTVASGKEALKSLSERNYDLIVLDVMMPQISGYDVLRDLQPNKSTPPVIILTARKRSQDKAIGLKLGAAGYLVKPVTRGKLLDIIDEFITPRARSNSPH
ncbi:MAG: response regulator [Anaerolineales bacterium]|jgi:DNA-binding response OmpR family regulator